MVSNYSSENNAKPPSVTASEIGNILSMRLIANLATLSEDGTIHLVPM